MSMNEYLEMAQAAQQGAERLLWALFFLNLFLLLVGVFVFIKGREATETEIRDYMAARGFRFRDGTWVRETRTVGDAVPNNVMAVKNSDGTLTVIPFDAQVMDSNTTLQLSDVPYELDTTATGGKPASTARASKRR